MSAKPDYDGLAMIYERQGIIKIGDGYMDFSDVPTLFYNRNFVSSNGIKFRYNDSNKIIFNNRIYNNAKGLLLSPKNIIYDYDTFTRVTGTPFITTELDKNKLHQVCKIRCVGQVNDKFTFMKVKCFNILVKGLFTVGADPFILEREGNSFAAIDICDREGYTREYDPPDMIVGPTDEVGYHIGNKLEHTDIKCPYANNHDSAHCEIIEFMIEFSKIYVAVCSGKIRLVDGKIAGQRTKAAAREIE